MSRIRNVRCALLAAWLLAPGTGVADVQDTVRGEALYENHCSECHDRNVHRRDERRVSSREELRIWVRAWSAHVQLGFGEEEVDDISAFLAETLYRDLDR